MRDNALACIGVLALVQVGCTGMKGRMAPDFELKDLQGATVRLSDLRGKPVLLSFWAVG